MENRSLTRLWLIISLIIILSILIPFTVFYVILSFLVRVSPELQVIIIAAFLVLGGIVILLRRNRKERTTKAIVRD